MTRVNVVPVEELCDQHLLAEAREIPRIPNGLLSGKLKKPTFEEYLSLGNFYRLGKGHVRFFCCRLDWLRARYGSILVECKLRGFRVEDRWPSAWVWWRVACHCLDPRAGYQAGWGPGPSCLKANRARIKARMPKKPRWGKEGK
jgi:hypothetical protein